VKALSLTQPWASLIADGRKRVETRSWRAPKNQIGQRIAIHAAKSIEKDFALECGYDPKTIPLGKVICTARLDSCLPTPCTPEAIMLAWGHLFSTNELKYGDFEAGRFAWLLSDVELITPPLTMRGTLGLWEVYL
jgi:hypothetical protein